jgi:demethylmenaquinone methyltransferase/2-methoxy-6-polyprenyl-1,4-benzoquinol methylase
MGDKPADSRGQSPARVKQLFDQIALRYDLINDLQSFGLHRLWKRRVLKLASVRTGDKALDLCCGTGDISFALAQKGADAIGLDFSERMLGVAEARKAKVRNGKGPQFLQGDAQQIPFPENCFDIVTIGYGLRNLESWEDGLREMWRVTKPGGRVLVLDFGKPDNPIWRGIYFGYLKLFVPLLGGIFCGDRNAYAYILESLKEYPAQRGVEAKMRALGFAKVKIISLLGGAMSSNYGEKGQTGSGVME